MRTGGVRAGLLVLVVAALGAPAAAVQDPTSLVGVVFDPTNRLIPGVSITLTPADTPSDARTAQTNGQGRYEFTGLRAGTYRFEARQVGFRTVTVDLTVTGKAEQSVRMQVGVLREELEIVASVDPRRSGRGRDIAPDARRGGSAPPSRTPARADAPAAWADSSRHRARSRTSRRCIPTPSARPGSAAASSFTRPSARMVRSRASSRPCLRLPAARRHGRRRQPVALPASDAQLRTHRCRDARRRPLQSRPVTLHGTGRRGEAPHDRPHILAAMLAPHARAGAVAGLLAPRPHRRGAVAARPHSARPVPAAVGGRCRSVAVGHARRLHRHPQHRARTSAGPRSSYAISRPAPRTICHAGRTIHVGRPTAAGSPTWAAVPRAAASW